MSEWKKVKLKDCCTKIGSGSTPKGGSTVYIDSGTSLIRSQNVYNLFFDYNGLTHITEEAAKKLNGVTIHPNDILLNITGDSVARTCIVPAEVLPARVNQHVAIVRVDDNKMYSRYLSYYLASPKMQTHMLGLAVGKGASRNAMTKQMIENFEVPCPPLDTQIHIATILSRYDSLIENYQKQIKLLEEAAQRLYKEWFVDLHFPGHENTKIVDGVPEGWEKKTLDSFCNVFTGKKNANQGVPNGEYKFFTCGDTPLLINSFIYDGPAIIISGNGSYTGRTTFYEGKFDLYQRTYACTIKDTKNRDLIYGLYEIVKCELTNKISGGTHGAAIPYIVMSDLTKFVFLFNDSIMHRFSTTVKKLLSISLKLSNNIRLLTEARDRLLPKLMSGEIAV